MRFLEGLNEAQRSAVMASLGPVLVLAGPGSGKTRVLTCRIAYLIEALRVPPWQIMAVTFTNKAAREMRQRLETLLGAQPQGLSMGTFHATCARILRRETDNLANYSRDFVIFDTADQLQVVKQALKDLNLDDKKFPAPRMLHNISNAKNELVTAELYAASNYVSEVTRRVYRQYQALLGTNNAMDFDDLIMNTVLLFTEQPDVLQRYQSRYRHILVDEFQDTNTAQYTLLRVLAAQHADLFVVGDSDQSIYRWRGADFRNIQRFLEQFPDAQQVLLEQNYRSTQIILDVAKAVIKPNPDRVHKELFTRRQGGLPAVVHEAYNEHEEADYILGQIEQLILEGYSGGDIAIMYRTNAQSRVLEESFLRRGLPYRVVGATEFYKRREIKDVIAYLRLVHNLSDSISFDRVLNVPPRGIGAKSREGLLAWSATMNQPPAEALIRLAVDPEMKPTGSQSATVGGRASRALGDFGRMLEAWIKVADRLSVGELMDVILEQVGYRQYLDDGTTEGEERWDNVMELRNAAAEDPGIALSDFLEQVALVSETDNLEDAASATTLLTLHAAKGLEYPVVFITGLEDGLLPHSRSLESGEELAEERRLFYVGITRARDRVYISHAFRRSYFGDSSVSAPSRFLLDIPAELVEGGSTAVRRRESIARASSWIGPTTLSGGQRRSGRASAESRPWNQEAPAGKPLQKPWPVPRDEMDDLPGEASQRPAAKLQFRSGQRVRHARFGEGTVIESKMTGTDEEVTVAFPGEGIKRLAASFARLELVE